MTTAIRAEGISKKYRLGPRERYGSLRDNIMQFATGLFRREAKSRSEDLWALSDVSFTVEQGEALGLIGHNGSGKSTLLKVLSRITEPTAGQASLMGRVGSLLEVGTGFHPELTGRENIYLNGAILGMKRAEITRRFDEIVSFAEVERFLDTPVKHYSSGMYMRLAFAVAAHLEPEILLVDEVLAVGDAAFQRKCLGKMGDISRGGRTVILVSHNMGAIKNLCRRAVWLERGRILRDGRAGDVVVEYLNSANTGFAQRAADTGETLSIERVILRNPGGDPTLSMYAGDALTVEVHFRTDVRIEKPYFWIAVASAHGPLFVASMLFDGQRPEFVEGAGQISVTFQAPWILPQTYTISLGARAADGTTPLLQSRDVAFFNVIGRMAEYGMTGEPADVLVGGSTSMILPYQWRLPDGKVVDVAMQSFTPLPGES